LPTSTWPYIGAVDVPVPPFAIPRTPVTSLERLMSTVVTTPATALRMPFKLPIVKPLETTTFVDDAVPATETFPAKVDVAVVEVAWKLALILVLLAVEGMTIQVGSVGGQLGFNVCPG
jgi:hypothetical protein